MEFLKDYLRVIGVHLKALEEVITDFEH